MYRVLSSCLLSFALIYSIDLAMLTSSAQAGVSDTMSQAASSEGITDFMPSVGRAIAGRVRGGHRIARQARIGQVVPARIVRACVRVHR